VTSMARLKDVTAALDAKDTIAAPTTSHEFKV
jgi:hypothetical protein